VDAGRADAGVQHDRAQRARWACRPPGAACGRSCACRRRSRRHSQGRPSRPPRVRAQRGSDEPSRALPYRRQLLRPSWRVTCRGASDAMRRHPHAGRADSGNEPYRCGRQRARIAA
jgi:hypothetical protein